jgi:membrane-associated phospholipid phosphatase
LLPGVAAQSPPEGPYHLSLKRELILTGVGGLSLGLGTHLQNNLDRPLLRDLAVNDYVQINGFDRLGTNIGSSSSRLLSDYSRDAGILMSGFLIFGKEARHDVGKLAVLYTETMLITSGLTNLSKTAFHRTRPYVFAPDWEPDRPLDSGDRASFVSGHTSLAAAGSFFFARVFTDYYPESKLKPYVWGVAITVPALTGYLRVDAAKHFPSDVIAGYALGAAVGWLVPTLHKKAVLPQGLSLAPAAGGLYLGYTF